jgi:hypothetical protein
MLNNILYKEGKNMSIVFSDWYKASGGNWYVDCIDTDAIMTAGPDTIRMSLYQVAQMKMNDPDPANRSAAIRALERRFQVYSGDPLKFYPPSHKYEQPEQPAKIIQFKPK